MEQLPERQKEIIAAEESRLSRQEQKLHEDETKLKLNEADLNERNKRCVRALRARRWCERHRVSDQSARSRRAPKVGRRCHQKIEGIAAARSLNCAPN
jgi:hypothetical protein